MNLESKALRAGKHLTVGHILAATLTLISTFAYSQMLGPRDFAIYAFCTSMTAILRVFCRMGMNARLLTKKAEPPASEYDVALFTMLVLSIIFCSIAIVLLPYIENFSKISHLFWPGLSSILLTPLHVSALPAVTRLERKLEFKRIVVIDLLCQFMGLFLGIVLTSTGLGIWGPLTGWALREGLRTVSCWIAVGLAPNLRWRKKVAFIIIQFGIRYTLATTFVQGRTFFLLSMVGRFFGQEAVGHIALTMRAATLIFPFRAAAARVMLPTIASISGETSRFKNMLAIAIETEILLSIPIAFIAVALYEPIIQLLLSPTWWPSTAYFPWVVAGALISSVHGSSLSALHASAHFKESIVSSVAICFIYTLALIGLNFWGIKQFAIALILAWPGFWLQDWYCHRRLGASSNKTGMAWGFSGVCACLAWNISPLLFIPAGLILFSTRKTIYSRMHASCFLRPKYGGTHKRLADKGENVPGTPVGLP